MRDSEIFYLRVCFTLFISVRFSTAYIEKITDPDRTFIHTASIHALFVKEPHEDDLTQYISTKAIFLSLHHDEETFSFYESDAPYTFFTFSRRRVDFELLYAETMKFSVNEGRDIWNFRCVFSADTSILDIIFPYLSDHTGTGYTSYRMNIIRVETYVRMEHMSDPIIEAVTDLQPAMLYDQDLQNDNFSCLKKIYTITPLTDEDIERPKPRLVFRTGDFQISQIKDKVALKLSACPDWFYILYFQNTQQSKKFLKCLSLVPSEPLDLPRDVQLYVETGSPNRFRAGSGTDSDSSRKQSRPDEGSSMQLEGENEQPKRRRPRTTFTADQQKRLRQEFNKNRYPPKEKRQELAIEFGLKTVQIRTWFQNERERTGGE